MEKIKRCTKQCGYTHKRCELNIPGWYAAICHCPIDGLIVTWEVCEDPLNNIDIDFAKCPVCGKAFCD